MADMTYSCGTSEQCHDSRFDFPRGQKTYGGNWGLIADELAEDYNDNHDGWEASWPLELRIYGDGQEVARFEVEKEMVPSFSAWEITPSDKEGGE